MTDVFENIDMTRDEFIAEYLKRAGNGTAKELAEADEWVKSVLTDEQSKAIADDVVPEIIAQLKEKQEKAVEAAQAEVSEAPQGEAESTEEESQEASEGSDKEA